MRLADPGGPAHGDDQATGLRRLFAARPVFNTLGVLGPDARRTARASAALALGLGRQGYRVLVLDEAGAPDNVGTLLNLPAWRGLADAPAHGLAAVAQPAGDGVALMAARDGVATLAGIPEQAMRTLAEDWRERADFPEWLLLNGGASAEPISLAMTAGIRVLVLPNNKARLADGYALMKAAQSICAGRSWLVLVEGADLAQARALFLSLRQTASRFLGITPELLGNLSPAKRGRPSDPFDDAQVDVLAEDVAARPCPDPIDFEQYWRRMWLYSRVAIDKSGKRLAHGQSRQRACQ